MQTLSQLRAGELKGITRLDLSCGLETFPTEIFDLADSLEILNLSGNGLSSLPDDLPRLRKLRVLFCSDNQFTRVPEVLGQCPDLRMVGFKANRISHLPAASLPRRLRWLILTDNRIEELPPELGHCGELQKLMLAGNRLQALPETMAACSRLELLRIAANRLTALPDCLFSLPRLSWLAFGGNPCSDGNEAATMAHASIAAIPWCDLELEQRLGEGASGVIHRAVWQQSREERRPVAVKLFKGAVTSDGLPHSEMAACIGAGPHPNLIAVAGRIGGHPDGVDGLVMSLIDPSFHNLAGPPSLESCTRDIYGPDLRFSLDAVLGIARGVACAAAHLHARGIMHGDLYAHNVLKNGEGDALLGDFGAASFFAPEEGSRAQALQRLEVRAFGCLLEELLQRCAPAPESRSSLDALQKLQQDCCRTDTRDRPLFARIVQALTELR